MLSREPRTTSLSNSAIVLPEKVGHIKITAHIVLPLVGNSVATLKTENLTHNKYTQDRLILVFIFS